MASGAPSRLLDGGLGGLDAAGLQASLLGLNDHLKDHQNYLETRTPKWVCVI